MDTQCTKLCGTICDRGIGSSGHRVVAHVFGAEAVIVGPNYHFRMNFIMVMWANAMRMGCV